MQSKEHICNFTMPLHPEICQPSSRREYEGMMESRLADLGANLDGALSKANSLKIQANDKLCEKIAQFRSRNEAFCQKLDELKGCSGEAWKEMKPGLDRAFQEVKRAWEELKAASERAVAKFH